MATWSVQLITLLGVVIGGLGSFISTRVLDRNRWHREQVLRWENKRLECYTEFAAALMRYINIGYRLSAGLGLPAGVQGLHAESALPSLGAAEEEVSVKWESMLMLADQDVLEAAQQWRREAWTLDGFARGLRTGDEEFLLATRSRRAAREQYYTAARADLGVITGKGMGMEPIARQPARDESAPTPTTS